MGNHAFPMVEEPVSEDEATRFTAQDSADDLINKTMQMIRSDVGRFCSETYYASLQYLKGKSNEFWRLTYQNPVRAVGLLVGASVGAALLTWLFSVLLLLSLALLALGAVAFVFLAACACACLICGSLALAAGTMAALPFLCIALLYRHLITPGRQRTRSSDSGTRERTDQQSVQNVTSEKKTVD
ncbi:MAG: hypothetical protein MHM6MM_007962 [Cercozoa sp. M6MM]